MARTSAFFKHRRSVSLLMGGAGGAILLAWLGIVPFGAGCASQEVTETPDAASPPCEAGPFMFGCDPIGDDQPGCNTDDGTSTLLTRLPRSTRYPVTCVVNFVGERDEQGNCNAEVCKCLVTTLTPPPRDAGDEAEAPAPSPISAPAWNCSR